MNPINNYKETALRMKSRPYASNSAMMRTGGTMGYTELLESMRRETTMLQALITYLKQEVDYIVAGDLESLEDSLPAKKKILDEIQGSRSDVELLSTDPPKEFAHEIRSLKQKLGNLWKEADALNEQSKELVGKRLDDINSRLEPFIKALKTGYDKTGKVSKSRHHTIKPGV